MAKLWRREHPEPPPRVADLGVFRLQRMRCFNPATLGLPVRLPLAAGLQNIASAGSGLSDHAAKHRAAMTTLHALAHWRGRLGWLGVVPCLAVRQTGFKRKTVRISNTTILENLGGPTLLHPSCHTSAPRTTGQTYNPL